MQNGKFDPTAGLSSSGIAGTAPDKEDEENKPANADEEMRDVSKKDGGKIQFAFERIEHAAFLFQRLVDSVEVRRFLICCFICSFYCLCFFGYRLLCL